MLDTPNAQRSPLDEVRHLKAQMEDVATGLHNQQDLLSLRGMSLPPAALRDMAAIQSGLSRVEASLGDTQHELRQLQSLVATSALINSSLDLDTVLANAMDEVINLTGAERGYILLVNAATGELEFRIARDFEAETPAAANGGYPISRTILNEVLSTGEPLLTDNAFKDPRMQNSQTVTNFALRSVLCVPLRYKADVIGAVYVDNRLRIAVFTERELNLLNAIANQIAVAIENARLFARLQATLAEITAMKELTENVFASIASGVITADADDLVTMCNNAAAAILCQPPDAAIGQPLKAVLPPLSADFDALLRVVCQQDMPRMVEVQPDVRGRGQVVLNMKLSPLKDADGETQGVAMVLDDLTAEREREQTINVIRRYLPPGMMDNIHHIAGLALGGERREVTCLFADVCSLAKLPHDMRPQQKMDLLNAYLSRATEAVHRADGLIDKYMGSEIMVLFNTQLNPQNDHARRAIIAALDLRDTLAALNESLGLYARPHDFRIGIHSGVATLGNVGSSNRRNFTAIGDTINLAKRLLENTEPGQIIVSEDALAYADAGGDLLRLARFAERGAIQVKGRQQQTPIYEVFGV